MEFSDYIVYVDESGDHNLEKTNPNYPIFVLVFCIVKKDDYYTKIVPAIQKLKFDFFGHDMVVLHEREISKSKPPFDFLLRADKRQMFMERLNQIIEQAPMSVIATVIEKYKLITKYSDPDNPYDIALRACMERTYNFLQENSQEQKQTHIIVESRGKKEDQDLELTFLRTCKGSNHHRTE